MLDFNALGAAIKAQEEQSQKAMVRRNFGKCTVEARYIQWVDHAPVDIDVATYAKLDERETSIELTFSVDIQEFNSGLEWTYSRKVTVGSSDWWKIVKPSLDETVGKGDMGEQLKKVHSAYVCVEDVLQTPTKKTPNPTMKMVKFAVVYPNREACHAAYVELFGDKANEPQTNLDVPPGDWGQDWHTDGMQAEFDERLKALVGSNGKDRVSGIKKVAVDLIGNDDDESLAWVRGKLAELEG